MLPTRLHPVIALALLATASSSFAAPRSRHSDRWLFGERCDFRWDAQATLSTSTNPSASSHTEGTSTWSDPRTGTLQISTDGIDAYGRGAAGSISKISSAPLGGANSLAQPIVVPRPGHAHHFYVFAAPVLATGSRTVTEFDVSVAPGVQVGAPSVVPSSVSDGEAMTAVFAPDGRTVWVLSTHAGTKIVRVIPITADGVGAVTVHPLASMPFTFDPGFSLIAAPNGKKIAYFASVENAQRPIVLFDFDPKTGTPSSARAAAPFGAGVDIGAQYGLYGGAFSPDGSKLYYQIHNATPTPGAIMQMDLTNGDATTLLGQGSASSWAGLGLGPDGKIYISGSQIPATSTSTISRIDAPNAAGAAAGFVQAQTVQCIVRLGLQVAPANVTARSAFDTDDDGIADGGDADADGDGIPDAIELGGAVAGDDNDNDVADYEDALLQPCVDADGDGVCDVLLARFDRDADGIPNHLDLDADGDGVLDVIENGHAALDADADGRIDDPADLDHDGLPGSVDADDADPQVITSAVAPIDTDGDGDIDALDTDSDDDCVLDSSPTEVGANRTNRDAPTPGGQCVVEPDAGPDASADASTSSSSSSSSSGGSSSSSGQPTSSSSSSSSGAEGDEPPIPASTGLGFGGVGGGGCSTSDADGTGAVSMLAVGLAFGVALRRRRR